MLFEAATELPLRQSRGPEQLHFAEHLASLDAEYCRLQAEACALRKALVQSVQGAAEAEAKSFIANLAEVGESKARSFTVNLPGVNESQALEEEDEQQMRWSTDSCCAVEEQPGRVKAKLLRPAALHAAPWLGDSDPVVEIAEEGEEEKRRTILKRTQSVVSTHDKAHGAFIGDIKAQMKRQLEVNAYDVKQHYKTKGLPQALARSSQFENTTMFVICMYAIWMAVDTDYNAASVLNQAHLVFQVGEHLFCLYFFMELVIRFLAFDNKLNCFRDAWFSFDFVLVTMMVLETWLLSIVLAVASGSGPDTGILGNVSILRLARLMRLTRLFRMARLLRMLPELLILVRSILVAARSVGFTILLLILVLYVFAIAMTQTLKGSDVGSRIFGTVLHSMNALVMYGTFLEGITDLMDELLPVNPFAFVLMYIFLLVSAITLMNMTVAILCEVITAVATAERETIQITVMKDVLERCLEGGFDANGDDYVDRDEFFRMLKKPEVLKAMKEIGIDITATVDFSDVIFDDGEFEDGSPKYKKLKLADFMENLMQFRGDNTATVRDMVDLRKWLKGVLKRQSQLLQCFAMNGGAEAPSSRLFVKGYTEPDLGNQTVPRSIQVTPKNAPVPARESQQSAEQASPAVSNGRPRIVFGTGLTSVTESG